MNNANYINFISNDIGIMKKGNKKSYSDFYAQDRSARDYVCEYDLNESNNLAALIYSDIKYIVKKKDPAGERKSKYNIIVRKNKISLTITPDVTVYMKVDYFFSEAQITYFIKKGSKTISEDFVSIKSNNNEIFDFLVRLINTARGKALTLSKVLKVILGFTLIAISIPVIIYPQYFF